MTITGIHHKSFTERLGTTASVTANIVEILKTTKHFTSYRAATKEEDLDGIDWWVTYPGSNQEVPIQFKLRDRQKDIPVCRFQPFYGTDHEKTVIGRDYRSLVAKKVQQYYVAVRTGDSFNEVYRISSDSLLPLIEELDNKWGETEKATDSVPRDFFKSDIVSIWIDKKINNKRVFRCSNGCEVWWKKNFNERSPKFNMYVPYKLNEWNYFFSQAEQQILKG